MELELEQKPSTIDVDADIEKRSDQPLHTHVPLMLSELDWDSPEDPDNPRNWGSSKKIYHLVCISLCAFTTYVALNLFRAHVPETSWEHEQVVREVANHIVVSPEPTYPPHGRAAQSRPQRNITSQKRFHYSESRSFASVFPSVLSLAVQ